MKKRQFVSGKKIIGETIRILEYRKTLFGIELIFSNGDEVTFGVEIWERIMGLTPPSKSGMVKFINGAPKN